MVEDQVVSLLMTLSLKMSAAGEDHSDFSTAVTAPMFAGAVSVLTPDNVLAA